MTVLSASATAGLVLKAKADTTTFPGGAGALKTGTATIGDATATLYPDADVGYAVKITANDVGDVATIVFADGSRTETNGSPVFVPSSAVDFSGKALPSMDNVYALRITASEDNAVALEIVVGIATGEILCQAGHQFLFSFSDAPLSAGVASLEITFGTAADSVTVEVLARATPA